MRVLEDGHGDLPCFHPAARQFVGGGHQEKRRRHLIRQIHCHSEKAVGFLVVHLNHSPLAHLIRPFDLAFEHAYAFTLRRYGGFVLEDIDCG